MLYNMRSVKNNRIEHNPFELTGYQVTIIIVALEKQLEYLKRLLGEDCTSNAVAKINLEIERTEEIIKEMKESANYEEKIKKCNKKNENIADVGEDPMTILYERGLNKKQKEVPKEIEKEDSEQLSFI